MSMTQFLKRSLQQTPDAIVAREGERHLSFAQFGDRVARLAGALRKLGVKRGDRVAMLSLNSTRYLEYFMAVPWAGGALNPCNIRWSVKEVTYSLDDSQSTVLIVDGAHAATGAEIAALAKTVRAVIHAGDGPAPAGMLSYEALIAGTDPVEDAGLAPSDMAGIFYTGGTTGFPKGVVLSHLNLWASSMGYLLEGMFPEGVVYLHAAPMFHLADLGMTVAVFLRGGTHAMVPGFTPQGVTDALVAHGITDMLLVPTMIQMLADHPGIAPVRDRLHVKRLVYGASPISEAVLERAMVAMPGVQFMQVYGMTELSPLATCNGFYNHSPAGRAAGKLRAAGRATFGVEVRIVDPDGREVPRGTVGEVIVRGPNVMQGYWNLPEQTAAALRDGWMHTGDGAWMDADGYVFIADRLKDMIISGGENVYSTEVENVLAQHPAVAACAVIGVPSERWGEAVHAVVVLKPGCAATAGELRAHCKGFIAGYKCPAQVEFRVALPLSGAGKVLKTELRKPYWERRDERN